MEIQNPDLQDNYLELANTRPSLLLEGDKPRLIDEWQLAPKLWNAVRYSVDNTGLPNQYILTVLQLRMKIIHFIVVLEDLDL